MPSCRAWEAARPGADEPVPRADHRRTGRVRPRPATAPRSRTCPRTCRSGTDIAATTENCVGTDCPRYQDCFIVRMRQRAAESDVVIVNHHLLCADAAVRQSAFGEVIPNCRFAIVDEAHQLEDVATQYFGLSRQQLPARRLRARRRPGAWSRERADRSRRAGQTRRRRRADREHGAGVLRGRADAAARDAGRRQQRRQPGPDRGPRTPRDWSTKRAR